MAIVINLLDLEYLPNHRHHVPLLILGQVLQPLARKRHQTHT